jgi:DNA excision repair protein ERCC-1
LQVNERQKGNPLLSQIRIIPWQFTKEISADYVMGSTCAIFLSLKYHTIYPKYVEKRIHEIGRNFKLRVLLVYVDDVSNMKSILDLNKLSFVSDFTLVLTWSNEECARYLETFHNYENKSSSAIQVVLLCFSIYLSSIVSLRKNLKLSFFRC